MGRKVTSDVRPRHIPKVATSVGCLQNWDAAPQLSLAVPEVPTLPLARFLPRDSPVQKIFLPCPKGFSCRPTPRTRLPNRFLECGPTCSPLSHHQEPGRGRRGGRHTHREAPPRPRAPRAPLSLPRIPAPERRTFPLTPRPAPTAAARDPAVNKGTELGVRVPERTGRGPLLSPGAPSAAPSRARGERREGRAARGRQAGMEGGTAR